jgi:predicted ATPase
MLKSIRIKNFKAIRDSKVIRFTPLTVFIGNNGSGKSSVIEALETYKNIVQSGLHEAMLPWLGFEHIRNQSASHTTKKEGIKFHSTMFNLSWHKYSATMSINSTPNLEEIFIEQEKISTFNKDSATRSDRNVVYVVPSNVTLPTKMLVPDDESIVSTFCDNQLHINLYSDINRWQFLNFNPNRMGQPIPQRRSGGQINLEKDGSNIAEYLLSIYRQDKSAFNGIVESLQYVLPYARDLQANITSELERNVYLQLNESNLKIFGWLFSTGTLRVLALLAVLRHPTPPPLIVIEEIENGLDPRTIHLIVEEIRNVVESGISKVIITTHSPYLLDLLHLSHLVLVERDKNGQPIFTRPANKETLKAWTEKFSLGKLYTMGQLSGK